MQHRILLMPGVLAVMLQAVPAQARPSGPALFCEAYPDSPHCTGKLPECSMCHTTVPGRNAYGMAVEAHLLPDLPRPLPEAAYAAGLPDALAAVESRDSDGDGFSNLDEMLLGSFPGNAASSPGGSDGCAGSAGNAYYDICNYDPDYALKKIYLDVCGHSPTFEEQEEFAALPGSARMARLHQVLDACLDSEFWQGKDGVLWQLAHRKIRPVGALKSGEDAGAIPLSDYYDDYHLFVYTQIDDHDARDLLTADYFVARDTGSPTVYRRVDGIGDQRMQPERRAGLLTTHWSLVFNIMFAALPRTAAAQAYRAFLGMDIARLQGLYPVAGEPVDYDGKGVSQPACAVCHATLDPLSYPFKNYNTFTEPMYQYYDRRIESYFLHEAPNIGDMPEAGSLLGQPVSDLMAWARVAAGSTQFLIATVDDYWRLLIGGRAGPDDEEFKRLWQRLGDEHGYSVERMLHELIETEAYGVP